MKSNPFFSLDDGVTLPPLVVDSRVDYCVAAPTRSSFESSEEPQTARTSLSSSSLESPRKTRIVERAVDVTEDMKRRTKELAVADWMMLPDKVWDTVKTEMTIKYGACWTGLHRDQVTKLVKNTRAEMGGDDMLRILEKDRSLHNLPSTGLPFLQFHGSLPHPEKKDEWMRYMIFGNRVLFTLLAARALDLFIDATFSMTPHPFYQVLIIMVHDCQTDLYVPVIYALMTHKCEDLYYRVMQELLACAGWSIIMSGITRLILRRAL